MRYHTTLLIFLLGIAIRVPALFVPIEEGMRNAQTAVLTSGMIEGGVLRLDPIAAWRGDLGARLVQELPLYNITALAIHQLPGISLDASGRLASLLFWALSFLLLQGLWRRLLPSHARFWANLLFILAPMNWYLSTAFMPETLVQLLTIGFLILALDYARQGTLTRLWLLTVVALLGLLVKLPAFAHLGLFFACVLVDRQGWRAVFRPRFLLPAAVVIAALAAWGQFVSEVNGQYFPDWTGRENLIGFIKPHQSRLASSFFVPLIGYNLAFVLPVIVMPIAAVGALSVFQNLRRHFRDRVWLYLAISLVIYWLFWAKGAAAQSYYNLPNLILFSALFGLGAAKSLQWIKNRCRASWVPILAQTALIFLLMLSGIFGTYYLSRPDKTTLAVAEWVNTNTKPTDIILFQPRHAPAVINYEHQPLLPYRTGRRVWIWTRPVPDWEKQRALQTATYAIVTNPLQGYGKFEMLRRKFKGAPASPPDSLATKANGLTPVFSSADFSVYKMNQELE